MKRLATIMIRPRQTMREILDSPGRRLILPLVLLSMLSAVAGDFDPRMFRAAIAERQVLLLAPVIIVVGTAVWIGIFYLFSWVAYLAGWKALEGAGSARDVRAAVAWGLVPSIWALLYRVPAIFLVKRENVDFGAHGVRISRLMTQGCWSALLIGLLELIVLVWCVTVMSNTVGEAHRFSSWRGLATILITLVLPLVILIAAVLAIAR